MKTLKIKTITALLIFTTLMISCSDDDSDGDSGNEGGEFLTAKVDGQNFSANDLTIGATITNGVFVVQGGKSDGTTIRINVINYSGTGTYTFGDSLGNTNSINYITLTPVATWASTFNIGSGTLTVTSDSGGKAEGTFSFTGFNADDSSTKNITSGEFKATLD